MTRILNLLKTTPDLDKVPEADWASGASSGVFDFSYIKQEIDPLSESGLELTLRALAPSRESFHASALTCGPAVSEKALRTLYALGYDECIRIDCAPDPLDPEGVASVIADFCRSREPYDLIVLGAQSPDGGTRKTPYLLAEYLGCPVLRNVTGFDFTEDGRLHVLRKVPGGTLEETVSLPLVISIGDVPGTLLRVPTLMQRKKSAGREITVVDTATDAGTADSSPVAGGSAPSDADTDPVASDPHPVASDPHPVREKTDISLISMELVDQSRAGRRIEGKTPAEIARILYEEYLK